MLAPIAEMEYERAEEHQRPETGTQINTQNESSKNTVKWLRSSIAQGCQAVQVMSTDWYSRFPKHHPHRLAVPPSRTLELGRAGK